MPKNLLIFFSVFLLCLTFSLTGCNRGGRDILKGKPIVLGSFWENYDVNTTEPGDENAELVLDWRRTIQREHEFTMTVQNFGWEYMLNNMASSILAGNPFADAFYVVPDWVMPLYRQNLLYAVSDSKAVDLTNANGAAGKQTGYIQEVRETFSFEGKSYALLPGSTGASAHDTGVFYNKRLFREAGLDPDLPYDMQKDGSWNWDNFLDISRRLTRDRNNTGMVDTWAMTADLSNIILDVIVFSNGGHYVDKDSNGRFVNATARPEFIEALQFGKRLMNEGILMPRPADANWDWYWPAFMDTKVAMSIDSNWRAGDLADFQDDWGYVFFPKGPRARDYRIPNDENAILLPATHDQNHADAVLTAIDLWYRPVSDDWKLAQWSRYRDSRAVDETLTMLRTGRYTAFKNYLLIPGLERGHIAWEMWWYEGEPAQLVESVSQNWNSLIADVNRM